ncbi:uncharacterized protein LOC141849122 isoform X1 [Brevipalpus obovatus]|uniref:uncharacterized protein LOC141849122 isoform X1 n=1 Tax=Brevipalpus obovatus TaxID=246614 RepID=UPI003D9EFEBA
MGSEKPPKDSTLPTLCITSASEKTPKSGLDMSNNKIGSDGYKLKSKEAEASANATNTTDEMTMNWSQELPIRIKKIIWTIKENSSKAYESTPPKTMKLLAFISILILFFAVLSLVLAQRDEAASKYGMAFPIEEASSRAEKRVAASLTVSSPSASASAASSVTGVPGEGSNVDGLTTQSPNGQSDDGKAAIAAASGVSSSEQDGNNKADSDSTSSGSPSGSGDGDEDKAENGSGDRNPRIVFIERLMGLHVTAPLRQSDGPQSGSGEDKESLADSVLPSGPKNPLDKLNAKWASRMRKFSIPLPSSGTDSQPQGPLADQPNPMLRYAAAAMMSRLVAAAARAQMEAQAQEAMNNHQMSAREGKDKDEEGEDETVPVIVATMRDERERAAGPNGIPLRPHVMPPMYGRPMTPRGPLVRGPPNGGMPFHQHQHQPLNAIQHGPRHAMPSMAQRTYVAPPPPPQQPQPVPQPTMRSGPMGPMQRRGGPVLVMLAVPVDSGASGEGRSSIQIAPIMSASGSSNVIHFPSSTQRVSAGHGPFYPSVPYTYARPHYPASMAASYAVPVHMPVPVMPSYYQRQVYHYPVSYSHASRADVPQAIPAAASASRPVVEVPIEIPVPYHVPMQVPMASGRSAAGARVAYAHSAHPDNEVSDSQPEHQLVLLYEGEVHHDGSSQPNGEDLEPSASDAGFHPANVPFAITRPLPSVVGPNKMKFWREMATKHAVQPGVRFVPVAVASSEGETEAQPSVHYPSVAQPIGPLAIERRSDGPESPHQPAFIVLAEHEGQDLSRR